MPQGLSLHIPFPSRVSVDVERARAVHLDWPRRFGLLRSREAEARHVMGAYADVAARFHPMAVGADLDLAVDQQSWFFVFDDLLDGPTGADPNEVLRLTREIAGVLDHEQPAGPPLVRAFADLWRRSKEGMSESWRLRAAANWRTYLSGYVTEAEQRLLPRRPEFTAHLAVRTRTIGAQPVLDMAERVGHFECPARALQSPLLTALRRIAIEIVILDNDIVSVEKEEALGDLNLVLLLERAHGCSRLEALEKMAAFVAERSERFLSLETELPSLNEELALNDTESSSVLRYDHDGLRTLMRGAYDWDQQAGRYAAEFIGSFCASDQHEPSG